MPPPDDDDAGDLAPADGVSVGFWLGALAWALAATAAHAMWPAYL